MDFFYEMMKKKEKKKRRLSIIEKERLRVSSIWFSYKKKKRSKNKRRPYEKGGDVRFKGELKDMRRLSRNDEAFCLPQTKIMEILYIIYSKKTPTPKTYRHWDEYAISFYLKMCTCFGLNYQHLLLVDEEYCKEPPSLKDLELYKYVGFDLKTPSLTEKMPYKQLLEQFTGVGFVLKAQPSANEISYEERLEQVKHMDCSGLIKPSTKEMSYEEYVEQVSANMELTGSWINLEAAFEFGFYSSGTGPDRIPYHLYLLLMEAAGIIDTTNDPADLKVVEEKICFFMTYFHSHLPERFSYHRDKARSLIANYDSTRKPIYNMDGYTLYPFKGFLELSGLDPRTCLSPQSMIDVMSIIHSRKTPIFWAMSWEQIIFYCKLCSCFGIEYHCLEAASDDAVCLMNTRRN